MPILVSDTSVLIDLGRAELLQASFRLDAQFVVPDLLYERELRDFNGPELMQLGLRVEALAENEVGQAQAYRRANPRLALPDTFALALAKSRNWLLLTGDAQLRSAAEVERVECHGVLWMLDAIHAERVVGPEEVLAALERLAQHHRVRLPRDEINSRIEVIRLSRRGRDQRQ
jgi:uncharacterized protein YacL